MRQSLITSLAVIYMFYPEILTLPGNFHLDVLSVSCNRNPAIFSIINRRDFTGYPAALP